MLDINWANRRLEALAAKANGEWIRTSKGWRRAAARVVLQSSGKTGDGQLLGVNFLKG